MQKKFVLLCGQQQTHTLKMDKNSCERIVARLNKIHARLGDVIKIPLEGIDEMKVLKIIRECHIELSNVGWAIHSLTNTVARFEDKEIDTSFEKHECYRIIPFNLENYTLMCEMLGSVQRRLSRLVEDPFSVFSPFYALENDAKPTIPGSFISKYLMGQLFDLSWEVNICEREILGIAHDYR